MGLRPSGYDPTRRVQGLQVIQTQSNWGEIPNSDRLGTTTKMGILNFFSKRDPEDYERKGDAFYETGAYGKAIVEYEQALTKLEKTSPWDDGYRNSLREKIGFSREKLALAHEKTAAELLEAGHHDDAPVL